MEPIIVIPAYNPDEKLIQLAFHLRKTNQQIIVVDDGSSQKCMHIFEILKNEFNCEVCVHNTNMGKGAALKTGLRYASAHYPESCGYVTADADGQHSPKDILKVADVLEKNPDCIILGTRNFNGKDIPFKSRWGNKITSLVFLLSTGNRCPDTQTGLRGIPESFLETCLSVPGNRYEYEMNMLMEIVRKGISSINVPIDTLYLEENKSSHFHPFRDSVRIYFCILKYSLSSLVSAFIDLVVFTLMIQLLSGAGSSEILKATVAARLVSGIVNFGINKHWVFQSKKESTKEIQKYFILFFLQLTLSWLFVAGLCFLPIPVTFIKILVDTTLFFISYQIQKRYIFNNNERSTLGGKTIFHKAL